MVSPALMASAPAVNKPAIASIIPTTTATIASNNAAINSKNSHLDITMAFNMYPTPKVMGPDIIIFNQETDKRPSFL